MRYLIAVLGVMFTLVGGAVHALDVPSGPVLLTVTGNIQETNAEGRAQFDRAMLEALEWHEVSTYSPYVEGAQLFSGPLMSDVLAMVQAQGSVIMAAALDDYVAQIGFDDAVNHGAILAMESGGRPLSVRQKGPIRVIFPLTAAQAEAKRFFVEMVWQLKSLDIVP
jgi:hypothetical protein